MEEEIIFIKVFVPYAQYHHAAYFAYDINKYGRLNFGTAVKTSLGIGIIISDDIPQDKLPNINIIDIYGIANEKETKQINNDWWNVVLEIHDKLSTLNESNDS